MHTENWNTQMNDQMNDHPDLERPSRRNYPKQLQTYYVPIDDVENTRHKLGTRFTTYL